MSKTTIIKTTKTVDMEGSGFPVVDVAHDPIDRRIVIRQDKGEIHITEEAAALIADILTAMGGV